VHVILRDRLTGIHQGIHTGNSKRKVSKQMNFYTSLYYKPSVSQALRISAHLAFLPEAHSQILATHQYTPQKQMLRWLNT